MNIIGKIFDCIYQVIAIVVALFFGKVSSDISKDKQQQSKEKQNNS
jgi:hypothetical protein